ncbi:MAG: DNA repair protein RecO [Bacteroidetes bacterium]|nr:DNA repair protein RecO [Bacteroidota bacterium]
MQQKNQGIILQSTRFQEKKNILKIYTLQRGMQSYIVHVGHSAASKIKAAHVLPLNQIEFTENVKNTRSLQSISNIQVLHVYQSLHNNPVKNTLAVFLNEILIKSLREQPEHKELFFFITQQLLLLDSSHADTAHFHLHFLIEMAWHLGFYPHNNYNEKNTLFDVQEGIFTATLPAQHLHYADSNDAFYLNQLLSKKTDFHCTSEVRSNLLNLLLLLYKLHLPNFGEVKSIQILKELLA